VFQKRLLNRVTGYSVTKGKEYYIFVGGQTWTTSDIKDARRVVQAGSPLPNSPPPSRLPIDTTEFPTALTKPCDNVKIHYSEDDFYPRKAYGIVTDGPFVIPSILPKSIVNALLHGPVEFDK